MSNDIFPLEFEDVDVTISNSRNDQLENLIYRDDGVEVAAYSPVDPVFEQLLDQGVVGYE